MAISRKTASPVALPGLQGQQFWLVPLVMVPLLVIYFAFLIGTPESQLTRRQIISEIGQLASLVFVLSLSVWASLRAPQGRVRWAWRAFSLAFATYTVAEFLFGYESIVIYQQSTPTPTIADFFYLPFYPLMAIGLLLIPAVQSGGISRVRLVVDAIITVGAFLGLGLVYVIGPNLISDQPPVSVAFLVAYPVGDSIMIVTLFLLLARGVQASYRPIFLFFIIGLSVFIYADISFDYLGLLGNYTVGDVNVDPFWAIGELAMSMAPLYYLTYGDKTNQAFAWLQRISLPGSQSALRGALQRLVLPYLSVAVVLILLILNQPSIPNHSFYPLLAILMLAIVVLIVLRQIIIGRDLVDAQEAYALARQVDELKSQFITSINHELRTPLMTMQSYIEVLRLRQEGMATERRTSLIEEVGHTNDALVDLVQSILEVRQLDQETSDFPHEPVLVYAALERAIALINPREARAEDRDLRLKIPGNLAIWGEAVRLQQILTNLLSNAIKYSPAGSPVEVTAQVVDAAKVLRKRRDKRQMVEIVVRDYGLGIPPDQVQLLFNRFVRLQRDLASNVVGSGLGLFLCRTLSESMDGTIWVESAGVAGQGSAFHVVLPLATTPMDVADEPTLPRIAAVHLR